MKSAVAHTRLLLMLLLVLTSACAPRSTAPPFIPPAAELLPSPTLQPTPTETIQLETPALPSPTAAASPSPAPAPTGCTNNLSFVQDITVPDGSPVQPGGTIEKEWLVTNSGTCDWHASYRLKLVGGELLGAAAEQALYPARAGSQVTLKITFSAPLVAGSYQSAWQAYAPDGSAFGDAVYLQILVQNP